MQEIRLRREEDRRRWNAQAERMAARGRALDAPPPERPERVPATAAPSVAAKAGSVLDSRHTRERGHGITYERKAVLCGKKGCAKLHGPYWYAFWSTGGRVRSVYIGKKFQTVESKCPARL